MSLPSDSGFQRTDPPNQPTLPTRTPVSFPLRLLTRGATSSRVTPEDSGAQSTSDNQTESRTGITLADLVDTLLKLGTAPGTPDRGFNGSCLGGMEVMEKKFIPQTVYTVETNHYVPHVQIEGKKVWEDFQSHATALEKDLQKFQDAVQELGSSLDLIRAARDMHDMISLTSQIIQENARKLFPRASIPHKLTRTGTGYSQRRSRSWPPAVNSQLNTDRRVLERSISMELKALADGVESLRLALEQFPEFGNTEVWPLISFEGDLKYWSLNLKRYEGQFESHEVQLYVHDLSRELGTQFEDVSLCLREFIDGVPTARLAQKHLMANLQNLATIATFFSAVTATTLQYSFGSNDNGISKAVNVFWFNSLVFSIASALNSFLVLTWRRANYSSPRMRIPWWLWIWIRQCPPVFLLISVVTFLAGLGCFTVSSHQAHFTSVIVIISEVISAFGLAALLVWLAYDKWSYYQQWQDRLPLFGSTESRGKMDSVHVLPSKELWDIPQGTVGQSSPESTLSLARTTTEHSTATQQAERARRRWNSAIKNVILNAKERRIEKGREILESLHMDNLDSRLQKLVVSKELPRLEAGAVTSDIQFDTRGESLAVCSKGLSVWYELKTDQLYTFQHHIGQARQIIWDHSGLYLMTRTNQAIYVWGLASNPARRSIIARIDTRYILSVPNATVSEASPLKLISVEGQRMNKLAVVGISGEEYMVYEFKHMSIQHIDIMPDGSRVLLAATNTYDIDGVQPMRASPGHKLMVFNLETGLVEHQVPLWYHVQYVTISANGKWAVVTFKDYPPPQLWHLHHSASGVRLSLQRQFCARERVSTHEFDPTRHTQFLGRGHFVSNDRYILCTTAEGKIHIWRRDKAHPVHVHGGLTLDKDKPVQIACSKTSSDFTFATRSHDGTVRIWQIQDTPTIEINTPGISGMSNIETVDPAESESQGIFIPRGPITESPQHAVINLPEENDPP